MNVWTNMHELNGITAALVESTGLEGSEAGTAIRAILSRTFGLGRDGSDGKGMKTLKSIANVDVRDGEGQFKSFAQVLGEVDNKWGKLTKNQQIALAQAVGGREHYSKFLSIMENYKTVINATNYSINSQNSAYSENQKYLNSTEGKINQLKVSMERLNADTLNTSFVKGTIDGTTSFINTIDKLVNKFGMFKVVMGTFSIGMALFSSKFKEGSLAYAYWNGLDNILKKIGITMKNISTQTVNAFKNIPNLIQATKNAVFQLNYNVQLGGGYWKTLGTTAKLSLKGIIAGVKSATVAVKALGITTKLTKAAFTFGLSIAIDYVVEKAFGWLDDLMNKADKLKEHVQDVNSNALGNIQNNSQNIKQLTQLEKEYDALKSKTKLSKEEQQKMYDVQNQIAQICPEVARGIDSQGNSIIKMKNGVKGLIEELQKKNKLENLKLANNFNNTKENYDNEVKESGGKVDKAIKEKNELTSQRDNQQKEIDNMDMSSWNSTSNLRSAKSNLDDLNKAIEKQNAIIDDNKGKLAIAKTELDTLRNPLLITAQGYDKLSDSQKEMANSMWDTVETVDLSKVKAQEIINLLGNKKSVPIIKQVTDLQNKLKDKTINNIDFEKKMNGVYDALSKVSNKKFSSNQIKGFFKDIVVEAEKSASKIELVEKSIDEVQKELSSNLENIDKYKKMLDEIKEGKGLSASTKKEILTKDPDLIPFLTDTNKLYTELSKRIQDNQDKSAGLFSLITLQQEANTITILKNKIEELNETKNPEKVKQLTQEIEELSQNIEGLNIQTDENGKITKDSMDVVESRLAQLDLEKIYMQLVADQGKEKAKTIILKEIEQTNRTIEETEKRKQLATEEYEHYKALAIQAQRDADEWATNNPYMSKILDFFGFKNSLQKNAEDLQKQAEEKKKVLDNLPKSSVKKTSKEEADRIISNGDKLLANGKNQVASATDTLTDSTKKNTDTTKENKEAIDAVKEAIKQYEIEIKKLTNTLNEQNYITEREAKGSKERRDSILKEIELIKQKKSAYESGIGLAGGYADSLFAQAGRGGGSVLGQQIIKTAEKYLGTPYVWAGDKPGGFDCSGLVQYVYKQVGIKLNRTSETQINNGTPIKKNKLVPGDLVFFGSPNAPHHVGIYAGDGKYIHAPKTGDVVKISKLNDRNDFATARRIISSMGNNLPKSNSYNSSTYTGKYANFINEASAKYGVNPNLIAAIIQAESDWNPNEKSSSGAMGLMQLMPENAQEFGISNPYDPRQSIMGGTQEIAKYIKKYNGDVRMALAAYNAGEGNVQKYGGIPPFKETQNYIPKVLGFFKQFGGGEIGEGSNIHNVINQAEEMQDKMLSFENDALEQQKQIDAKYKSYYEDFLVQYENDIKAKDEKIKQLTTDSEIEVKNNQKFINSLKTLSQLDNDKLKIIQEEKKYVEEQIKNKDGWFSNETLREMKEKSEELTTSIKEISKTLKDVAFQWVESQLQNIKQRIQENVDMIENAISRLDSMPTVDLNKKVILSSQLVDLDKQNIEELTKLIKDLNEEEAKTGDVFLFEKIKELNGELDKFNTKLIQDKKALEDVKNAMGDLASNIEDKIKQVIQKNNELYKQSLEKNLKLFEEAVDNELKKLEDAERKMQHNESEFDQVNKIAEIQQKLNRLDLNNSIEAKQQRLDLEKELQQELRTQRENELKYEIENRKSSLQKAKDEYSKELDKNNNKLAELDTDENLTSQAKQALLNGYITDLNNNVISLDSALTTFEDKFGKGLGVLGNKIKKESIDNLHEVQDILKQFGTLDVTKINPNEQIRNIYGKGVDLENTKKILGIQGYKYIDVDLIDQSKLALTPDDIVVGGQGTTVDRLDLNGAMRLGGKERGETEQIIQIFRDMQNGKIQKQNGTVYGSGVDLLNAKKWLAALGYNFIDTATTNVNASEIGTNDFVVGGSLARGGVGFNVQNRLGGKDRYETDKAIEKKFHELIAQITNSNYRKNAYSIGTVYGSGSDLESARKYLTKFGYRFIETNNVEDIDLKPYDIVVGGTGVMKGQDRIINSRANWFDGQNRNETLQKIINFANKLNGFPVNTQGFSKGGVVDFTGYAMVHGGNGHDEVMLNNGQATNLYNFIKNIPNYVKNMASQINYPVVNNNNINQKDWLNKLELTGAGDTYDIKIEVNGDLKATEDEANEFASRIINKLRKRG